MNELDTQKLGYNRLRNDLTDYVECLVLDSFSGDNAHDAQQIETFATTLTYALSTDEYLDLGEQAEFDKVYYHIQDLMKDNLALSWDDFNVKTQNALQLTKLLVNYVLQQIYA